MATLSSSCIVNTTTSFNLKALQNEGLHRSSFHKFSSRRPSNVDLVVKKATPEAAGDLLSSFSLPTLQDSFSLPGENPWFVGAAGLLVAVPLMIQKLLTLTKDIDTAAQTVEKIADVVGKVAEEVDKAAEDIGEALPEGGLKKVVSFVEDLAEETVKDAQIVEDWMDQVEELDDKLEEFLEKQFKGSKS